MLACGLRLFAMAVFCVNAAQAAAETPPTNLDQFLSGLNSSTSEDGSVPFSLNAFEQAQKSGEVIVIHVNAFWCSTCGAQRLALSDVLADLKRRPEFADLKIFRVDFDNDKDAVARLHVQTQGTLIVFRGMVEVGRSIGTTDAADVASLLMRARVLEPSAPSPSAIISASSYFLAFLAGILSSLSPCVLPLLPIVIGSAAARHRFGAVALVAGFFLSFVAVGVLIAAVGSGIGLDRETIRLIAAWLMVLVGVVLLSTVLQQRLALAEGAIERAAEQLTDRFTTQGLGGQFLAGMTLGGVWTPCIGPTLGAALSLAGERDTFGQVSLVMLSFGLGIAAPLTVVGLISRNVLLRWRRRVEIADHAAKMIFGGLILTVGLATLTGADRTVEAFLIGLTPEWLTRLSTQF
jgi:cytochrome c biogenesis protein CcdA